MDRDTEFTAYVTERSASLRRYAYLLTGSSASADDLLQESLVKVYRRWEHLDPEGLDPYVRTVIARTNVSFWRHVGRRETPVAELRDVPLADHAAAVVLHDELWRLLAVLGPRQRAVVVLRFWSDLPEAEIAATLDCSVGTVKSQLHRALARLRASLPDDTAMTLGGVR